MSILIRNGWLADGTGNPIYPGDVMIEGERIVAVERLPEAQAEYVIEAQGKIVCPGFIDCHSHTDWSIHANPSMQSTVRQGVTTEIIGKNFEEIAALWGKDPWDCYFDIMAAAGAAMDELIAVGRLFTDEHVAEMVSHPLISLEADIISSDLDSPLRDALPFKASYAGMIHFLTCHVRQRKTLRLEDAVRKMTSMPATHFELRERGLLRKGYFADLVVLDYENLDDGATDSQPFAYAKGVEYVIVNGTVVIKHSEHTGERPGRNLLRT